VESGLKMIIVIIMGYDCKGGLSEEGESYRGRGKERALGGEEN
jgi:hypothetical protein